MTTITKALAALMLISSLVVPAVAAKDEPAPRLVTVTGDADVLVVPDEAVLRLSVQTKDAELDDATSQANRRVANVLRAAKKLGVSPKHIKTDHMSIWPDFRYDEVKVRSYRVRKSIAVTIKDVDKLEAILNKTLRAGANGVERVEFRSTTLRKHRDQARLLAIRAAREKAVALASALGQKVGRPHSITEQANNFGGWGGWWGRHNVAQNAIQNAGPQAGSTGQSTALGQLRINAKVTVSFELQ